ncbi:MAG: acyltransferase [Cyanobacteria bacterium P01_G01_bin.67]
MSKVTRLIGIDLCRALAAFAVILVHSGDETWGLPISKGAIHFRHLFYYAVPFFIAAFFYFSTKKLPLIIDNSFWHKKLQRIIIPYLLWSIFYVVSKAIKFSIEQDTAQLDKLLSDPWAIIFLGAASYHLYFIPMLLAGTFLLHIANYLNKQPNLLPLLLVLTVVSTFAYQLTLVFHNDFNLDSYTAFPDLLNLLSENNLCYQVWRIVLVYLSWIIRCSPYFFTALLTHKSLKLFEQKLLCEKETIVAIFLIFLLINFVGSQYLPVALSEIVIAYSFLLFGITISQHIYQSDLITNLGIYSFGIYLIHPFAKSAIEIVLIKLVPQMTQSVSITSMLIYAVFSFLISWLCIAVLHLNKIIAQYT